MPELTINIVDGVRVGPEDHVLITMPKETTKDQLLEMFAALKDHPLGDRITVITDVESVTVMSP